MLPLLLTALLLLAPCAQSPACAAFKSSSEALAPEASWNPAPLKDDIILPMPCGLSMVLRAVGISSGALIRDKAFPMGINNAASPDRQLYERRFTGHVSAPFTLADLPKTWQAKAGGGKKNIANDSWYFIGKYEVSRNQWDAVMNCIDRDGNANAASCPKLGEKGGNLPVTGISWFDVQEFLNKYNAWLVKNHAAELPAFSGAKNIAFMRLPTEEEWEYAARAYPKVPQEWWADQDFFPLAEGRQIKDYAVNSQESPQQAPAGIGSRLANPLGIHDTAGNASEMVDGFFRMSIADISNGQVERRLHGASGGILAKGGSFRSEDAAVMPGSRDEFPLYSAAGPGKASDLGFRVVLASLTIPNAQRLQELRKEAGRGASAPQPEMKGDTAIEMADSLLAQSEGKLRQDLQKLRAAIGDQEDAWQARARRNAGQSLRSLLYQSETLRNFAFRYSQALKPIEKVRNLLKGQLDQAAAAKARKVLAEGEKDLKEYKLALQMGANYYKDTLASLAQTSDAELERMFAGAREEYGSGVFFDEHMRNNLDILARYLKLVRKEGMAALDSHTILKGILPEQHFKLLGLK